MTRLPPSLPSSAAATSTPPRGALRFVWTPLAVAASIALAACGGGAAGDPDTSVPPVTGASAATAQETSANTTVVPTAASESLDVVLQTAEIVVANALANVTASCPGGGTAVYQVTGATGSPLAQLTNGKLDAGEVYSLTFTNCRGAAGFRTVNGALTLTVNTATATQVAITTATSNLVVTHPRGTVTMNGASTLTRDVVTNGTTVTTTSRWQTPTFTIVTAFGARTSTFTFSAVDRTRTVTTVNGTVTGSTYAGTTTFTAALPNGGFTITESTQGGVTFDATGLPVAGSWTITLPNNRIGVSVAGGVATVTVDWGPDGRIDRTYTFPVGELTASAG